VSYCNVECSCGRGVLWTPIVTLQKGCVMNISERPLCTRQVLGRINYSNQCTGKEEILEVVAITPLFDSAGKAVKYRFFDISTMSPGELYTCCPRACMNEVIALVHQKLPRYLKPVYIISCSSNIIRFSDAIRVFLLTGDTTIQTQYHTYSECLCTGTTTCVFVQHVEVK
jgi:hypothetical protein